LSACRKAYQQALDIAFGRALPDDCDRPAEGFKGSAAGAIAGKGAIEFDIPELDVGARPLAARTIVPVPKAAMDKHRHAVTRKDDIGRSRKVATMQAIPVAGGEKRRTNSTLGGGILAADGSHHL
jgi:hypothetical protein